MLRTNGHKASREHTLEWQRLDGQWMQPIVVFFVTGLPIRGRVGVTVVSCEQKGRLGGEARVVDITLQQAIH